MKWLLLYVDTIVVLEIGEVRYLDSLLAAFMENYYDFYV